MHKMYVCVARSSKSLFLYSQISRTTNLHCTYFSEISWFLYPRMDKQCLANVIKICYIISNIKATVGDEQAEPGGGVKHIISLESFHAHERSKSSFYSTDSYLPSICLGH